MSFSGLTAVCLALNYSVSFQFDSFVRRFGETCDIVELFPSVNQKYVVLEYQTQSWYTKPVNLEMRPLTPELPGFLCQIFIEAETLYGHGQTDGCGHKQQQQSRKQQQRFTETIRF